MTGRRSGESTGPDWEVYGVDSLHPDRWEMRKGVNYIAGLRRAQETADRLGEVLNADVPGAVLGVHAEVAADGAGVVWLAFDVQTAERIAGLLDGRSCGLKRVGGDAA